MNIYVSLLKKVNRNLNKFNSKSICIVLQICIRLKYLLMFMSVIENKYLPHEDMKKNWIYTNKI